MWPRNSLAALILRAFLWLPACFFLWYMAADYLLAPIEVATTSLMKWFFPNSINGSELKNGSIIFDTNYQYRGADGRIGSVAFKINVLRYTFNLPVIAALTIAVSPWKAIPLRLLFVYALLLPIWLWGAAFYYLKTITLGLGPEVSTAVGITGWPLEIIGLLYQFGYLMLPAISVPIIWLFVCKKDFGVVTAAFSGMMPKEFEMPNDIAPAVHPRDTDPSIENSDRTKGRE